MQPYITQTTQYVQLRQQALSAMTAEQSLYESTLACLNAEIATPPATGTGQSSDSSLTAQQSADADQLDTALTTLIDPAIAAYQAKAQSASSTAQDLENVVYDVTDATNDEDIQTASTEFSQLVTSGSLVQPQDVTSAQADLVTAQQSVANLQTNLIKYQSSCTNPSATQ